MQSNSSLNNSVEKVEKLLEEVYKDISTLTEENFDEKFPSVNKKMQLVREIKSKNSAKSDFFSPSKKIIQLSKLIAEKYDNVTKDWANKLKLVQKEIELSQNQKKITIYNR
jgi:prophage DNA circulation protein